MGVSVSHTESRVRYPLRAIVAVVCGSLVALAELVTFSLFMMPMIPLVPVFVAVMLGNAMWMSSLLRWAAQSRRTDLDRREERQPTREPARPARGRWPVATAARP